MRKLWTRELRGFSGLVLCLLAGTQALAAGSVQVTITNRVAGSDAGEKLAGPRAPGRSGAQSLPAGFDAGASVQDIYKRFTEATKASGDEIDLAVTNVTTYYPHQFSEIKWFSLFTLPSDLAIDTVPHQRDGKLPSKNVVSFRSSWQEASKNFEAGKELLEANPELSAASVLARLKDWEPARFQGVSALSSFDVEVSFQGKNRNYRAMILWKPLSTDRLLFTLVDHVVPGVDLAFSDQRPIVKFEEIVRQPETFGENPQAKVAGCYSRHYDLFNPTLTNAGFEEHNSGNHNALVRMGRTCDTTFACESFCTPYAGWGCEEWGSLSNLVYSHRMFASTAVSAIAGYPAGISSQCGFAVGCAVKNCFFGACSGVQFGASGFGASIALRANDDVLRDLSVQSGGVCPGAEEREPICHCCASASAVTVVGVSNVGDRQELPSAGIPLRRLEESGAKHHGQNVRYLMAEWALVSYSSSTGPVAGKARILGASSDSFGQAQIEGLVDGLAPTPRTKRRTGSEQIALLVATPSHEANSRRIPMPEFELAAGRPPLGSGRGTVLVMADFDEEHQLQELRILHDTVGGVSQELATYLERSVSLRPFSSQKHRVVVFALLSVGANTEVETTYSYLPKCCCGTEFCI